MHETEAPGAHTLPVPPPPPHPTMTVTRIATPIVDRTNSVRLQLPALGRPQSSSAISVSRRPRERPRRATFDALTVRRAARATNRSFNRRESTPRKPASDDFAEERSVTARPCSDYPAGFECWDLPLSGFVPSALSVDPALRCAESQVCWRSGTGGGRRGARCTRRGRPPEAAVAKFGRRREP